MAALTEHSHPLNIRSPQMKMPSSNRPDRTEDYDRKLKDAQEELERIQEQREELERRKLELAQLISRKHTFVTQQIELTEKLTSALTQIDRELLEMRNETEDIEQCRACFADHLDKIHEFNPEYWSCDNLSEQLAQATIAIDLAVDEFDQMAAHFEGSRISAILGRATKRGRVKQHQAATSGFLTNLSNGFAFNLPVLVLGGVALLVYLLK